MIMFVFTDGAVVFTKLTNLKAQFSLFHTEFVARIGEPTISQVKGAIKGATKLHFQAPFHILRTPVLYVPC
jgi:hypothetical protein